MSAELALQVATTWEFLVLDHHMPDLDGYELCCEIRRLSAVPIVIITESSDEFDRILGLRLGADDCVSKPMSSRELVTRIEVIARRRCLLDVGRRKRSVLRVGDLAIDVGARTAEIADDALRLTRKEFDLLAMLAEHVGVVCPREKILERVWDENWHGPTRTLDVHVGSLRRKLGRRTWIETVRAIGFRMVNPTA